MTDTPQATSDNNQQGNTNTNTTEKPKLPKSSKANRQERIDQLKARLQKEEALLKSETRKERNGQLVAWGLFIEAWFQKSDEKGQAWIEDQAPKLLEGRNLERAKAGFDRLKKEIAAKKKAEEAETSGA